jgi:hypothetical protein
MIKVADTQVGQRVIAITGSTKTGNLAYLEGIVTGYTTRSVTGTHVVLEAEVRLENGTGEIVRTHRLEAAVKAPVDGTKFVVEGLELTAGGRRVRTASGRTFSVDSIYACGHAHSSQRVTCGHCEKPVTTLTEAQEAEYRRYVSEGIGDTDGYYAPVTREAFFGVRLA